MSDDKTGGLLQFAAKAPGAGASTDAGKPALVSDRQEYRAAVEWLAGERDRGQAGALLVPYGKDGEEIIAYTQLMSIHRDNTEGYLCMHFTIGTVEVFGENLKPLFREFLPPGGIKELVLFDPLVHQQPKPGEPVIFSVRYRSRADILERDESPKSP